MPAKSKAQFRWLHTADAKRQLGAAGQREWISSSNPSKLPGRVPEKRSFGKSPVSRST